MRKMILWVTLLFVIAIHCNSAADNTPTSTIPSTKPNLQHGVNFYSVANIDQYFVSEKLDGIRGYWDGQQLLTRQGNLIHSPHWFTKHWPKHPVDGELWIERNKFQVISSCVRKKHPKQKQAISCWKDVRFMIFDLPSHTGKFSDRVLAMQTLVTEIPSPYFSMITQVKFNNIKDIETKLTDVIAVQGEGLMLHLASSYYKAGRNKGLMKFKRHQDAEATVIGYTRGKGKYENNLGAIKVKMADGKEFKIGSGFTDKERANPPKIGAIITFKYNGLTQAGIPKFARFWRVKAPQ